MAMRAPSDQPRPMLEKGVAMTTLDLPSLDELKAQAKRLRAALTETGRPLSHSQSLEAVARQRGYRDWNTLHAAAGNRPPALRLGQTVGGVYLGQPFRAEIVGLNALGGGRLRLTLDLEEAVDVVTFDSFSAFRSRLRATIGPDGTTAEKTSDCQPHLRLTV